MTKIHPLHVRVTDGQVRKLGAMQEATGLTPSQLVRLLIDNAEVKTRPVVKVPVEITNRHDAKVSQATSVMTVSA